MLITLPSGLAGEFRGLTAKDLRYLTNEKLVRDNQVEDFVLKNAWQGMTEAGPYKFQGRDAVDWGQVLSGDRATALIEVRIATFPDRPFITRLRCTECRAHYDWEFDLVSILRDNTKKLSKEDAEIFRNGNRFEAKMPGSGAPFTFKLRNGSDSQRLAAYLEQKKNGTKQERESVNPVVDAFAAHIVSIEGLAKGNPQQVKFDYLEKLGMGDFQELIALIQGHDCGVDTDVETECPKCGAEQEVSIPFGQRGFFNPGSVKKNPAKAESLDDEEVAAANP